ncbi:hypothetical protein CM318V1_1510046 [Carnobacterium maltaromaticum]|nr:hypothetical protein CM318V1_1510046 [Carnobacterium maltaromaticum]
MLSAKFKIALREKIKMSIDKLNSISYYYIRIIIQLNFKK